ncbi:prepilin-type N-terminal cleavage/methylation domain-containing protein [Candidatus Kaiserbacteria bacterium]|nr:prepilin-type N-terminal cleavage/methylation domain-containing protein [Candidatus Kaiserbacteria bacterium]
MFNKIFLKRGMTLVEMMVAVSLFSILTLVVTSSINAMYRYNSYTFAQAYQVQNARLGMQSLIRDVREMTFADDGTFPLAIMEENKIAFYSDIDRDNSVEYVEFSYNGTTTIIKNVYNATGSPLTYNLGSPDETYTLSRYVQNNIQGTSTFMYYDNDGNQLFSPSDITDVRFVQAQIIVNIDPVRDPGQFMLRSSASLRNVKENI